MPLGIDVAYEYYFAGGVVTTVFCGIIIVCYIWAPIPGIRAHPAPLFLWRTVCDMFLALSFVVAYVGQFKTDDDCLPVSLMTQFFLISSNLWFLVLSIDLFIAVLNPFLPHKSHRWLFHSLVWGLSLLSAVVLYDSEVYGLSSLNFCWIQRTETPRQANLYNWALFYAPVTVSYAFSIGVVGTAVNRFKMGTQRSHRTRRRVVKQSVVFVSAFGTYWLLIAAVYFWQYQTDFTSEYLQIVFAVMIGLRGPFDFLVWAITADLPSRLYHCVRGTERTARPVGERTNLLAMDRLSSNGVLAGDSDEEDEYIGNALRKDLMQYTAACIHAGASVDRHVDDGLDLEDYVTVQQRHVFMESLESSVALRFFDYSPRVFADIRHSSGVSAEQYTQSFQFESVLRERPSEGKSGMLFYFTPDKRFMVKTISQEEFEFLWRILPAYHRWIAGSPTTRVCRFYGCHRIELPVGWTTMYFVVMNNVFPGASVDLRFDLKGFLLNRKIKLPPSITLEQAMSMGYCGVLLDHEFVHLARSLNLTADVRTKIVQQLRADCGFLEAMEIMDYSLLLGVRKRVEGAAGGQDDEDQEACLRRGVVLSADGKEEYYFGLIDILQQYSWLWAAQRYFLGYVALMDMTQISAVPPQEYTERFLDFMDKQVFTQSAEDGDPVTPADSGVRPRARAEGTASGSAASAEDGAQCTEADGEADSANSADGTSIG